MKNALVILAAAATLSAAAFAQAQTRVGAQVAATGIEEIGVSAMFRVHDLREDLTLHLAPSIVNHPNSGSETNVVNEARLDLRMTYDGMRSFQPYVFVGAAGLMMQDNLVPEEEGDPEYSDLYYEAEPHFGGGVILGTDCAFQPYLELNGVYYAGVSAHAIVGVYYAW